MALFTSQLTSSSVTLSWPDATDNVAITKYELLKEGVVIQTTNAYTTKGSCPPPQTTVRHKDHDN